MSVSFNGSERQQGSIVAPFLITTAAAGVGAGAGALVQEKITAEKLAQMQPDSFKRIIQEAPKENRSFLRMIQKALKLLTPRAIASEAKSITKNAKSITVKTFLQRMFGTKKITIESLNKEIAKEEKDAKKLETKVSNAQKALERAKNKEKAQAVLDNAKAALEEHQISIDNAKSAKNVAETAAKNGKGAKISLDTIKELYRKMNLDCIDTRLKSLGKDIPKIKSGKNPLIGAAIGALVGAIGYLLFGRSKN